MTDGPLFALLKPSVTAHGADADPGYSVTSPVKVSHGVNSHNHQMVVMLADELKAQISRIELMLQVMVELMPEEKQKAFRTLFELAKERA